jgi:hypothetical protein
MFVSTVRIHNGATPSTFLINCFRGASLDELLKSNPTCVSVSTFNPVRSRQHGPVCHVVSKSAQQRLRRPDWRAASGR